jgi:sialic acid synthase SpsE/sugar phosphate isomerase/epimerase
MNNESLNNFIILNTAKISEALQKILENKSGLVFIVDSMGKLEGALSDGDFRRWILTGGQDLSSNIKLAANLNPHFITQSANIDTSFPGDIRFLPVLNDHKRIVNVIDVKQENILIGKHNISAISQALIIAELGNNHNGSIDLAFQLIESAKECGADIVKFQMRDLEELNRSSGIAAEDVGVEYTNNLLEKFNLSPDQLYKCFDYAKSLDLEVMCTPFDQKSLRRLIQYEISAIKIASADLTNHPLLLEAAKSYLPLIISTGMSSSEEIESAFSLLKANYAKYIPLHCNSTYPTPFKDVNLKLMGDLARYTSHHLYGYSGHERGFNVCIAAVAIGAKVIEKHFTLDRDMEGNDHRVSLLPNEFSAMVRSIREVEESLGSSRVKKVTQGELINRESLAKSLVAARDISEGEILYPDMLEIKSPGRGVQPDKMSLLLGKKVNRSIARHDFIFLNDLGNSLEFKKYFTFNRPFGVPVRFHDVAQMIAKSNINVIEFHLTYKDLSYDISSMDVDVSTIKKIVVHAPELFGEDHILDLASKDEAYVQKSLNYLNQVVDVVLTIKNHFLYQNSIELVLNVGGFTETSFLTTRERAPLYEMIAKNLRQCQKNGVDFLIQTMPPYPWHFGGQRHHNLYVDPQEIKDNCERYGQKICLDVSHTAMAAHYLNIPIEEAVMKLGPYTSHLHISDALGLDGEGLQIGDGELNFDRIVKELNANAPNASFIPEIWQGHKDSGRQFYYALERLEKYGL